MAVAKKPTRRPRVRCSSTGYSSARYGACEVCHEHVADVWIGTGDDGYTHVFGHESCVRKEIGATTR
jgi:hypothetical protein